MVDRYDEAEKKAHEKSSKGMTEEPDITFSTETTPESKESMGYDTTTPIELLGIFRKGRR